MASTTWRHRVPLPDNVNLSVPEDDPDTIEVWSETEAAIEADSLHEAIQQAAWRFVGIPFNPDAALQKYARRHSLGAPLTVEFDFVYEDVTYRGQGFALGIAYCEVGQWGDVLSVLW